MSASRFEQLIAHEPIPIPPLGNILDLFPKDAENARRLDEAGYKGVADFEDLPEIFQSLSGYAQSFQTGYGTESKPLNQSFVRIHSTRDMAQISEYLPEATGGGFFDPKTGILHVERKQPETFKDRIWFYYALAHETGHQITNGLNDTWDRLGEVAREGEADRFARGYMKTVLLPSLYPQVLADTHKLAAEKGGLPVINGITLDASDIVFAAVGPRGIHGFGFSRVLETRAMAVIAEHVGSDTYKDFMRMALTEDKNAIYFLGQHLGESFWTRVNHYSIESKISAAAVMYGLEG